MKYRRLPKIGLIVAAAVVLLAIGGVLGLRQWYVQNLGPVSSVTTTKYFTVVQGDSLHQIALNLKSAGLIRSVGAFETYARSRELNNNLQAGTYELAPSMGVRVIVQKMASGDVARDLVTILPGQRLAQIEQTFAKQGYSQQEIDQAFDSATYADQPLVASLPRGISLEGLLYPDSFQKGPDTPASALVRESLDEMGSRLTSDIQSGFAAQGLNLYQGITLASIVEKEVGDPTYQSTVAQVFLLRLRQGMDLQSDVTAFYASDEAGVPRTVNIDSPYNTYLHPGLPPGPISTITVDALRAVANPSNTNYLYFIAGDNGKIYFAHTQAEHDAQIKQYCIKLCAQ